MFFFIRRVSCKEEEKSKDALFSLSLSLTYEKKKKTVGSSALDPLLPLVLAAA